MQKINFQNYPNTSTPLSAENMNLLQTNIENGISDSVDIISSTVENNLPKGNITIGGKIGIEWGTVTVSISGTTNFSGSQAVTFLNNYASTPCITATFLTSYANNASTEVITRSETGCTVSCHTTSASTATRIIGYLVVGVLAEESEE